jgi:uncharacterized DUF497 family protein
MLVGQHLFARHSMRFEWDENKNQLNLRKHGVDFRDAAYVFSDPFALSIPGQPHIN